MNSISAPPALDRRALEEGLRKTYARIALFPQREHHIHTGRSHAERLGYTAELLSAVPAVALDSFCGMANPFLLDTAHPGETVLDAGCGSGTDAIIASGQVGPGGRVIGIDPVAEMLSDATEAGKRAKRDNLELHRAGVEQLPLEDDSVDLVIANGVINHLVPDKLAALTEIRRVLRPNGRVLLSDVFVGLPMPGPVREEVHLWTT